MPGYRGIVALQCVLTGLYWVLQPPSLGGSGDAGGGGAAGAAEPVVDSEVLLAASGWLVPAEAAQFALSCAPPPANVRQRVAAMAGGRAGAHVCTLLALPSQRALQLEGGATCAAPAGAPAARLRLAPRTEGELGARAAAAAASPASSFVFSRAPPLTRGAARGDAYTLRSLGGCCVHLRPPSHLRANASCAGAARLRLQWLVTPHAEAPLAPQLAPQPAAAGVPPPARLSLRLLQWNVRDGCGASLPFIAEPERLGGIGAWVRRSGVDVLGLNELNGWSASTFGQLAQAWGLPYSVLLEGATGYHLGLASRWPLALEEANFSAPFHHGVLIGQVAGIRVAVTHLSPADAGARLREAEELVERGRRGGAARGLVLMGDLNTLSPLDTPEHDAIGLAARLAADPALARKFLRPATELGIDYAPMAALLRGGLHDAGHATSQRAARELATLATLAPPPEDSAAGAVDGAAGGVGPSNASSAAARAAARELHNHSVPTLINEDAMHAAPMRLDYALLSPALAASCVVTSRLVRDADTERLSDHYPLLTDLDCSDDDV